MNCSGTGEVSVSLDSKIQEPSLYTMYVDNELWKKNKERNHGKKTKHTSTSPTMTTRNKTKCSKRSITRSRAILFWDGLVGLVIALRPRTPKHIRSGWSHYTDTSEPVDCEAPKHIRSGWSHYTETNEPTDCATGSGENSEVWCFTIIN
jgi:hypothetical protein